MKLNLTINIDNDVFFEEPETELGRIFRVIIRGGFKETLIKDINGNIVGDLIYTKNILSIKSQNYYEGENISAAQKDKEKNNTKKERGQ